MSSIIVGRPFIIHEPAFHYSNDTVRIDLNCDMGEGSASDEAIMPHVTSINVACGFHAGGPATIRRTIALAARHGVAVGAHPGLADREGFGRRRMALTPSEVRDLTTYQVGAVLGFAIAAGVRLQHVKPHGALYEMAATDDDVANAIAEAVHAIDPELILFGLAGSTAIAAGARSWLRTASEAFVDRGYRSDGTLIPRDLPGALLTDAGEVVERAIGIARDGVVRSDDGTEIRLRADTLCIHSDTPGAAALARALRERLLAEGILVTRVG